MTCTGPDSYYLKKKRTAQQNRKKTTMPAAKIHLSSFARRSTIRIVSPLTPRVFATLYSRRCVPLSISRCWPKSASTERPRSRNWSSCEFVFARKDCSRRAWVSRLKSEGEAPKLRPEFCGAFGFVNGDTRGNDDSAYGFSGVAAWCGRRPRSSFRCVIDCYTHRVMSG